MEDGEMLMSKLNELVPVLFALEIGVLLTQLAIDESGKHLGTALMIGALGTVGFVAAYGSIGVFDAHKKVRRLEKS